MPNYLDILCCDRFSKLLEIIDGKISCDGWKQILFIGCLNFRSFPNIWYFCLQSIFYMLQDYCNHFPDVPRHNKPWLTGKQASKDWVEWAIIWTMDQKVPGEQLLKQLERPGVLPLCIHWRQQVAISTLSNKSLGKLVCGHLASCRSRLFFLLSFLPVIISLLCIHGKPWELMFQRTPKISTTFYLLWLYVRTASAILLCLAFVLICLTFLCSFLIFLVDAQTTGI